MPLGEAIAFGLEAGEDGPAAPVSEQAVAHAAWWPLTKREREVAALVAQGLTSRQIAQALVISQLTAHTHVRNIRHKLGFKSRAQIASWAGALGLTLPRSK